MSLYIKAYELKCLIVAFLNPPIEFVCMNACVRVYAWVWTHACVRWYKYVLLYV